MPEIIDQLVDFTKCKRCEHYKLSEANDICHECLQYTTRPYTATPLNFNKKGNTKTNDK